MFCLNVLNKMILKDFQELNFLISNFGLVLSYIPFKPLGIGVFIEKYTLQLRYDKMFNGMYRVSKPRGY